jgi:hypothetical protein
MMMNAINTRGEASNLNPLRGPQLPLTVLKSNREDINDKFCKFEINKSMNGSSLKEEEQLSETGWSLDADPPESVNNEPISDRLIGLDIDNNKSRLNNQINSFLPLASAVGPNKNVTNFTTNQKN